MSHRRFNRDYHFDDYTFGDSKAEVTLAKLLTEKNNTGLARVVGSMLGGLSTHLRNIQIKNEEFKTRIILYQALRTHYLKKVDENWVAKEYPEVTTFFKNSIVKRINAFRKNEIKEREKK